MMIDIRCKRCNRFLGQCDRDTTVTLKCPNCRCLETYEIVLLWPVEHKPIKDVRPHHYPTHLKGPR